MRTKRRSRCKITVDVLRADGSRAETITRAGRFHGVLFCCKYKGYVYHIFPNVIDKKHIHNKPFIILTYAGESHNQPFAGHDGGQEGADD